jgi:NhaP-type Na+/H+ or K+/H+ antiporter
MLLRRKFDNRVLFIAGSAIIALRFVLQRVLDRAGVSTDVTDFVMGLLLGVGIGCLILFVWRMGKERRGDANRAETGC